MQEIRKKGDLKKKQSKDKKNTQKKQDQQGNGLDLWSCFIANYS